MTQTIELGAGVTSLFFEKEFVLSKVNAGKAGRLSWAGSYIRTTAAQSIRSRRKPSAPGNPPSNHDGKLRDGILFSFDPATGSVVVGPRKLNILFFGGQGKPLKGLVPQVLEFGGDITAIQQLKNVPGKGPTWMRMNLRRSIRPDDHRPIRNHRVTIAARPYMRPALDKNVARLPSLFEGMF